MSNKVSLKILIPIIGILVIGLGSLDIIGLINQNKLEQDNERTILTNLHSNFLVMIEERENTATSLATNIAGLKEVQELFAEKDRQGLVDLLYGSYKTLSTDFGVSQAQFHLPPATSF